MESDGRWRRLGSRVLFAGGPQGRIRLTVDEAVRPDGETVAYPYVAAPDSVRVLAVRRGRVAAVTQYHYLHQREITDLPGGLVDEGELPVDAARRELAEETGLKAAWLHRLGTVATARATSTETCHLFLAHQCAEGDASLDAGEVLRTHWEAWPDVAESGFATPPSSGAASLADAASLAAVQWAGARLRGVGGELPARDADVMKAAWAAYTVAAMRDPVADDGLSLVWLDLAIGRYAQGAAVLDELLKALQDTVGHEGAWARAADRFLALSRPT